MTGFGGAIKNIGMGCGSRAGKMEQHSSGKCIVDEELCRGCRKCAKECGSDAITYENNKAVIHEDLCKGCGRCIGACSFNAIRNEQWDAGDKLDRKMAEYAQAVEALWPAVDATATPQGWRRPLMAWMELERRRLESAGASSAAQTLARRLGATLPATVEA